ncbi:Transcription factor tau subunit sfc6, partial [Dissostichus eleginoides]
VRGKHRQLMFYLEGNCVIHGLEDVETQRARGASATGARTPREPVCSEPCPPSSYWLRRFRRWCR